MPVFAYTFSPENPNTPERIELVGQDDQHIDDMRAFLMKEVIENAYQGIIEVSPAPTSSDKVEMAEDLKSKLELLRDANPNHLPVDTVGNILELDGGDTSAKVDKDTGVLIYISSDNEPEVHGFPINPDSPQNVRAELSDNEEAVLQAIRGRFNFHGYAIEPRPGAVQDYTEHISLGYMEEGAGEALSGYTPVVTVLNESHPIRLLIEAAAQPTSQAA